MFALSRSVDLLMGTGHSHPGPSNSESSAPLTTSIASSNATLDVCFCFDATMSMAPYITQVKACIVQLAQKVTNTAGLKARFALSVYRDYSHGTDRSEFQDFQSAADMQTTLSGVQALLGGSQRDLPEDCFGGLWIAATKPSWNALIRVIVWMGDAPQHGTQYYDGGMGVDFYPKGDPSGITAQAIFTELKRQKIILTFCKLGPFTDKMIATLLQEAAAFGPELLLPFNAVEDMNEKLLKMLNLTAARTGIDANADLGPEKEYVQVPADFVNLSTGWTPPVTVVITSLNSFQANDAESIGRVFRRLDIHEERPRNMSLKMTTNPADSGETRIVYYAMMTDETGQPLSDNQKYVVKESKFQGRHNCKEALQNQACMQATAASLAREFSQQLQQASMHIRLEYVPVDLVHVSGRPQGQDWLTMEPFIEGDFVKFNSNNGLVNKQLEAEHPAVSVFSHFTYCRSQGQLMVTDLQGVVGSLVYTLTDPAIHTDDQSHHFPDPTNLGKKGMKAFFQTHECQSICKKLSLSRPKEEVQVPAQKVHTPVREVQKSSCHCWPFTIY